MRAPAAAPTPTSTAALVPALLALPAVARADTAPAGRLRNAALEVRAVLGGYRNGERLGRAPPVTPALSTSRPLG